MADTAPADVPYVGFGLDQDSLVHGKWTTGLCECSPASSYDWFACFCPCLVMAQVEMHLAALRGQLELTAFGSYWGDAFYKVMITAALPCVWIWATTSGTSAKQAAVKISWIVAMIVFASLWWYFLVRHMRRVRREIRERLQIPPASCSDTAASLVPVGGVIIQMGRQLDCHKRPYFKAPAVLPAYEA